MRKLVARVAAVLQIGRVGAILRGAGRSLAGLEGVAGVAAVGYGCFHEWGVGWAAMVVGGFLLLAAGVRR